MTAMRTATPINATYSIYDGDAATGTLLDTVTVEQTKAPVGTDDGDAQFQELGGSGLVADRQGNRGRGVPQLRHRLRRHHGRYVRTPQRFKAA